MAYKDLLLQLSSYPEATASPAIEQAVSFAEVIGARLSALTFEIEIHVPANPLALAILDVPGMVAVEKGKSVTNARDLVSVFSITAAKHGVAADHIVERGRAGQVPEIYWLRSLPAISVRTFLPCGPDPTGLRF